LTRVPSSGKILWGLGLVAVLEGNTAQAAERLERAVELLPEWSGSYSTLGVFYYQTAKSTKRARSSIASRAAARPEAWTSTVSRKRCRTLQRKAPSAREPMPMVARQQLLQFSAVARRAHALIGTQDASNSSRLAVQALEITLTGQPDLSDCSLRR